MQLYIIKMSFFINDSLEFVENSVLAYSDQQSAFDAMKRHQEIHIENGYDDKSTPSEYVLIKVDGKTIYKIQYEINKIIKAID